MSYAEEPEIPAVQSPGDAAANSQWDEIKELGMRVIETLGTNGATVSLIAVLLAAATLLDEIIDYGEGQGEDVSAFVRLRNEVAEHLKAAAVATGAAGEAPVSLEVVH